MSKQKAVDKVRAILAAALSDVPDKYPIAINIGELVDTVSGELDKTVRLPQHRPEDQDKAGYRVHEAQGSYGYAFFETGALDDHGRPTLRVPFLFAPSLQEAVNQKASGAFFSSPFYLQNLEGPVEDMRRFFLAGLAACEYIDGKEAGQ